MRMRQTIASSYFCSGCTNCMPYRCVTLFPYRTNAVCLATRNWNVHPADTLQCKPRASNSDTTCTGLLRHLYV
jgi:hypothetical protein